MKRYCKIVLYAFLIEMITFPLRGVSFMGCAVVSFILFFIFQYFISKKYREILNVEYLLLFSLIGASLLQIPLRLCLWSDTLISLPDFLFHLLGIVMGYLFYKSSKIFKTIIVLFSLFSCVFMYFTGGNIWLHKLNFGTFTGKTEQIVTPDFQFFDETGELFSICNFAGKYTVIDCWYSGCGFCFREFPKVQAFYDQYKEHPFVSLISMNSRLKDESDSLAFEMIRKRGYSFPVYRIDMGNPVLHQLGVNTYPTVLIFDKGGQFVFRGNIETAKNYIENVLQK